MPANPQWEYMTVVTRREAKGSGNRSPEWEPRVDLNRLGAEGWEVVGIVPVSDWHGESSGYTTQLQYVMKRLR